MNYCLQCKNQIVDLSYILTNRCKKFILKEDLVTGAIELRSCDMSRQDEKLCGTAGNYFDPKPLKISLHKQIVQFVRKRLEN